MTMSATEATVHNRRRIRTTGALAAALAVAVTLVLGGGARLPQASATTPLPAYALTDLGTNFVPAGVSDNGEVVGNVGASGTSLGYAAAWVNGQIIRLPFSPTIPGYTDVVSGINASGQAVGQGDAGAEVLVWSGLAAGEQIPAPDASISGNIVVDGIDDQGNLAIGVDGTQHAQLGTATSTLLTPVPGMNLVTLVGDGIYTGITNTGTDAYGLVTAPGVNHPLDFTPHEVASDGAMAGFVFTPTTPPSSRVVLRLPDGTEQTIYPSTLNLAGMNAAHEVLGDDGATAYLLHDGVATTINSLLPPGWSGARASTDQDGIDDHGDIVGTATYGGVTHGFLLRAPTPQLSISSLTLSPNQPTVGGGPVTATLTVRNDYPGTVTAVTPTLTSSDATILPVSSGPSPSSASSVAAGASTSFVYTLNPLKSGTVDLQPAATAVDPSGTTVNAPSVVPRVVTVTAGVLSVAVGAAPNPTVVGRPTTVTATLLNNTADTLTALTPSLTASPTAGLTVGAPNPSGIATLAPHASTTVTWPVTPAVDGTYSLTASVDVTDPNTGTETDVGTGSLPVSSGTIVVTTTGDQALPAQSLTNQVCDVDLTTAGNQCTLRAAVQLADALGGTQSITFDIPGGGVPTISPASALPAVSTPVTIDGTTEPGGWVVLSGASDASATGLSITDGNSTVRGLVISGWATGIALTGGAGDLVAGDRIGTSPDGSAAVPNQVGIALNAPHTTIGQSGGGNDTVCAGDCNVISGNSTADIQAVYTGASDAAVGSSIVGNVIGTDVTGTTLLGSSGRGIDVSPAHASSLSVSGCGPWPGAPITIGGATAQAGTAPGNLIDEGQFGVAVRQCQNGNSTTQAVQADGNLLGANWSDTGALNNFTEAAVDSDAFDRWGSSTPGAGNVFVYSPVGFDGSAELSDSRIGVGIAGTAQANQVGVQGSRSFGSTRLCADVVSGNTIGGKDVILGGGDLVGTDPTGTTALPNTIGLSDDVQSFYVPDCPQVPNVISGNIKAGIENLGGNVAWSVALDHAFIGTDSTGTKAIPNGAGLVLTTGGFLRLGPQYNGACGYPCDLVSGNSGPAISVSGAGTDPPTFLGDSVGSNAFDLFVSHTGIGVGVGGGSLPNAGAGIVASDVIDAGTVGSATARGITASVIANNGGPAVDFTNATLDVGYNPTFPMTGNQISNDTDGILLPDGAGYVLDGNTITSVGHAVSVAGGTEPDLSANAISGTTSPYALSTPVTKTPAPGSITVARTGANQLVIGGALAGVRNLHTRIDAYSVVSCAAATPSLTPLGSAMLPIGLGTSFRVLAPLPTGGGLELTATDLDTSYGTLADSGHTSPFSTCVPLGALPTISASTPAAGAPVTLSAPGFSPGEQVSVTLHSTPVHVATVTADGGGQVTTTVTIPTGTVPGAHELILTGLTSGTVVTVPITVSGAAGYDLVGADGGVFAYGSTAFAGSAGGTHLNSPVVGMAATPDSGGYWLVGADGGVFAYGDATFEGSAGRTHLNSPVVGMAATPDGGGYWLVAADGGVFAYGDATFEGSAGGTHLNSPVVGMAATPDGGGYWLVGADGGVFAYGDAGFHGSAGGTHLNSPVVGMAATPDGGGYWLVGADGGVFAYGDASFYGSTGGTRLAAPVVGMAPAPPSTRQVATS